MPLSLLHGKCFTTCQNAESTSTLSHVHLMMDIFQLESCILFKIFEHWWLSYSQAPRAAVHTATSGPVSAASHQLHHAGKLTQSPSGPPLTSCPVLTADPPKPTHQRVAGILLSMTFDSNLDQRKGIAEYFCKCLYHIQDGKSQSDQNHNSQSRWVIPKRALKQVPQSWWSISCLAFTG